MEFEDADPCNVKIVEKYQNIFFPFVVQSWLYASIFALVYSVTKLCSFQWCSTTELCACAHETCYCKAQVKPSDFILGALYIVLQNLDFTTLSIYLLNRKFSWGPPHF